MTTPIYHLWILIGHHLTLGRCKKNHGRPWRARPRRRRSWPRIKRPICSSVCKHQASHSFPVSGTDRPTLRVLRLVWRQKHKRGDLNLFTLCKLCYHSKPHRGLQPRSDGLQPTSNVLSLYYSRFDTPLPHSNSCFQEQQPEANKAFLIFS